MAGQIERDYAIGVRERTDLMTPICPITRPAVDEDQRAVSPANRLKTDRDAVEGLDTRRHPVGYRLARSTFTAR